MENFLNMLAGRVAVVVGASGGIGHAIVKVLLAYGVNVAAVCHSKILEGFSENENGKLIQYKADIINKDEINHVFEEVEKTFGNVDYVINAAGIVRDALFFMMSDEQFDDVISTNLYGCFNVMHGALPYLVGNERGAAIVNVASVAGLKGSAGQANYAASKAGMIAMTKALAKEVGRKNIRVNCVAPGFIETSMTENLPLKKLEKDIPMYRFGKPEEVANVVLFLLSDGASYINGETIVVDGGMIT